MVLDFLYIQSRCMVLGLHELHYHLSSRQYLFNWETTIVNYLKRTKGVDQVMDTSI